MTQNEASEIRYKLRVMQTSIDRLEQWCKDQQEMIHLAEDAICAQEDEYWNEWLLNQQVGV
jgi:hypothetical protein